MYQIVVDSNPFWFMSSEDSLMAKALEEVGLKAYSEDTNGYMKSREITLVLNMLRVISRCFARYAPRPGYRVYH